jgi:hypothetical protein
VTKTYGGTASAAYKFEQPQAFTSNGLGFQLAIAA